MEDKLTIQIVAFAKNSPVRHQSNPQTRICLTGERMPKSRYRDTHLDMTTFLNILAAWLNVCIISIRDYLFAVIVDVSSIRLLSLHWHKCNNEPVCRPDLVLVRRSQDVYVTQRVDRVCHESNPFEIQIIQNKSIVRDDIKNAHQARICSFQYWTF